MSDEWAVRIHLDAYLGPQYAKVGAFKVVKATPKRLMGEALYMRQHPVEDCVRGLSEAAAKELAEGITGKIEFSKDVIMREQDAIRSSLCAILAGDFT